MEEVATAWCLAGKLSCLREQNRRAAADTMTHSTAFELFTLNNALVRGNPGSN